ncbi:MAG: DNA polymerase III subunit delta' [Parvularculaceae bacterium]|nr:DNA polymerase III subunit delta' [Parvularculaceae bacterium]
MEDITSPRVRANFIGWPEIIDQVERARRTGALANGWLITGGEGAGKATFAFRLARALLATDTERTQDPLGVDPHSRTFSLVASGGHPDLFVAQREYDEKKDRYAAEIKVDTIRELTSFLNHTPSMGGWRVAIIDTADDLNRNAANALLKVLEEPPRRTAIFVLSAAPGRLLATIRSRCRRIELRPVTDQEVAGFLASENAAHDEEAQRIAAAAKGRPGYALTLALGDGAAAIDAVEAFINAAFSGGDVATIAHSMSARNADSLWALFRQMLLDRLASGVIARAEKGEGRAPSAMIDACERISTLFARGEAVNLDRFQMVLAAGRELRASRATG